MRKKDQGAHQSSSSAGAPTTIQTASVSEFFDLLRTCADSSTTQVENLKRLWQQWTSERFVSGRKLHTHQLLWLMRV
jgi:hypothetical protein